MKKLFKKAKTNLKDHLRPHSSQSLVSSQAQSSRSSQDLAATQGPDEDSSIMPLTTVPDSQLAIEPVSSAKSSTAADDLPPGTAHPAPPNGVQGSNSHTIYVTEAPRSSFDELRDTMNRADANLFTPLQVALVDLIRIVRSLQACTICFISAHLDLMSLVQSYFNAEPELTTLEARIHDLEVVAGATTAEATVTTNKDLQNLLRAIAL